MQRWTSAKKRDQGGYLQQIKLNTPSKVKSMSTLATTNTNYLNLRLEVTQQKHSTLQRSLAQKDRRINELQQQIKANQQLVHDTLDKWKQHQSKCKAQQVNCRELQYKLLAMEHRETGSLQQINELEMENIRLKREIEVANSKSELQASRYNELKARYKQQKKELRRIFPQLFGYFGEIKQEISKMESAARQEE